MSFLEDFAKVADEITGVLAEIYTDMKIFTDKSVVKGFVPPHPGDILRNQVFLPDVLHVSKEFLESNTNNNIEDRNQQKQNHKILIPQSSLQGKDVSSSSSESSDSFNISDSTESEQENKNQGNEESLLLIPVPSLLKEQVSHDSKNTVPITVESPEEAPQVIDDLSNPKEQENQEINVENQDDHIEVQEEAAKQDEENIEVQEEAANQDEENIEVQEETTKQVEENIEVQEETTKQVEENIEVQEKATKQDEENIEVHDSSDEERVIEVEVDDYEEATKQDDNKKPIVLIESSPSSFDSDLSPDPEPHAENKNEQTQETKTIHHEEEEENVIEIVIDDYPHAEVINQEDKAEEENADEANNRVEPTTNDENQAIYYYTPEIVVPAFIPIFNQDSTETVSFNGNDFPISLKNMIITKSFKYNDPLSSSFINDIHQSFPDIEKDQIVSFVKYLIIQGNI